MKNILTFIAIACSTQMLFAQNTDTNLFEVKVEALPETTLSTPKGLQFDLKKQPIDRKYKLAQPYIKGNKFERIDILKPIELPIIKKEMPTEKLDPSILYYLKIFKA